MDTAGSSVHVSLGLKACQGRWNLGRQQLNKAVRGTDPWNRCQSRRHHDTMEPEDGQAPKEMDASFTFAACFVQMDHFVHSAAKVPLTFTFVVYRWQHSADSVMQRRYIDLYLFNN